ncbi:sialate O-acetylesterase [Rubritalea profundi]|nr:sialate O-acetylesterase [Rubritalea profundi]
MKTRMRHTARFILCISLMFELAAQAQDKSPSAYSGAKEDLHIYLLIGQSNMAGRAPITKEQEAVITNGYLLNADSQWEPAKNPLNRYSTIRKGLGMQKLNPGYSFAEAMLRAQKGISIGLIVNAKGGSKIGQWKKGTRFYNDAVKRAQEAQKTGTLKGILWHQGESDNGKPDGYIDQLEELVKDLRSELKAPKLPFVAGQVNNAEAINKQIGQLPKTLPDTGYVSSEGLKAMDRWHFDTKIMLLLGEGYAKEMLKIQQEN